MNSAFVLQINPADKFRLYDALRNLPDNKEIVLHPGPNFHGHLIRDTKVFLWEVGGKDLVGVGTIIQNVRPTPMPDWQHRFSMGTPDRFEKRVIVRVAKSGDGSAFGK